MNFQDAMERAIRGARVQIAGTGWFVTKNPLDRQFRKVREIPGMEVREVYAFDEEELAAEWEVRE